MSLAKNQEIPSTHLKLSKNEEIPSSSFFSKIIGYKVGVIPLPL